MRRGARSVTRSVTQSVTQSVMPSVTRSGFGWLPTPGTSPAVSPSGSRCRSGCGCSKRKCIGKQSSSPAPWSAGTRQCGRFFPSSALPRSSPFLHCQSNDRFRSGSAPSLRLPALPGTLGSCTDSRDRCERSSLRAVFRTATAAVRPSGRTVPSAYCCPWRVRQSLR